MINVCDIVSVLDCLNESVLEEESVDIGVEDDKISGISDRECVMQAV
jgi:hypothetical protein